MSRTYQVCLLLATLLIAGEVRGQTAFYIGDTTTNHVGASGFDAEYAVLWRDTMLYQHLGHAGDTVRKFYVKSGSDDSVRRLEVAIYECNTTADTPTVRHYLGTLVQNTIDFGWDSTDEFAVALTAGTTYVVAINCVNCPDASGDLNLGYQTASGSQGTRYKSSSGLPANFVWTGGTNSTATYMFYARGDSSGTAPTSSVLKVGPVKLGTTKLGP